MCLQDAEYEGYWFPLPEGWCERPLGELFEVQLGKMKGKNASLGEQFSYLKGRNLQWGDVQVDSLETMHFSSSERVQYELLAGDLLVCEYGEVGRCAIWEDSVPNCYFQNHIYRIRATGDVPVEYLRYFLEYATKMPGFSRFVTQTSVQQISQRNLRNIPIPYCENNLIDILNSLNELTEIGRQNSNVVDKISSTYDGFTDDILSFGIDVDGKLRDSPSNELHYLSLQELGIEVLEGDRGNNYPSDGDFNPTGHCLFLSAKNVTNKGFIFEETLFITEQKDRDLRAGKLQPEDIVVTTRGTIGNVSFFDEMVEFEHMRVNSGMAILRNNGEVINTRFLYLALSSELYRQQLLQRSYGTAQPQLNQSILRNFQINVPNCLLEQERIVRAIDIFKTYIRSETEYMTKHSLIRTGLITSTLMGVE